MTANITIQAVFRVKENGGTAFSSQTQLEVPDAEPVTKLPTSTAPEGIRELHREFHVHFRGSRTRRKASFSNTRSNYLTRKITKKEFKGQLWREKKVFQNRDQTASPQREATYQTPTRSLQRAHRKLNRDRGSGRTRRRGSPPLLQPPAPTDLASRGHGGQERRAPPRVLAQPARPARCRRPLAAHAEEEELEADRAERAPGAPDPGPGWVSRESSEGQRAAAQAGSPAPPRGSGLPRGPPPFTLPERTRPLDPKAREAGSPTPTPTSRTPRTPEAVRGRRRRSRGGSGEPALVREGPGVRRLPLSRAGPRSREPGDARWCPSPSPTQCLEGFPHFTLLLPLAGPCHPLPCFEGPDGGPAGTPSAFVPDRAEFLCPKVSCPRVGSLLRCREEAAGWGPSLLLQTSSRRGRRFRARPGNVVNHLSSVCKLGLERRD